MKPSSATTRPWIDEKQTDIRLNLGIAYYKTEDYERALREFAQVVSAQPANYQARLLLGLCNYQLNKLNQAVSELEVVYTAQPNNVAAAYALATAYLGLNQTDKAAPLVDKVFRQVEAAEAHLILGSFNLAVKQLPKALEEFAAARAANPRLPPCILNLAMPIFSPATVRRRSRSMQPNLS